jgi:VWFA-related protein
VTRRAARGAAHLGCLVAAALPLAAAAQAPAPPPLVIEADVQVVSITAVVHDKAGRFVPDLTAGDVTVLEDGVPQALTYFRPAAGGDDKIPLSIVLVLDASGSMKPNVGFLQEAAIGFVRKLEDVDQALVVSFNESIKGSADFSGDVSRLEDFVDALQPWGGTSLYDAIHYALGRVKDQPGRKALVVFSDGDDTTSSLQQRDAVDYARAVEATIYCVGIQGGGPGGGAPRGFLKKIAQETGGQFFFPDRVGDLIKVFAQISDELHNHYALAYSPLRPPDGSWRAIQVRVARPDAVVRVRKGYFAVKRRLPAGAGR